MWLWLLLWPAIGIPAFYRSLPRRLRPRTPNDWLIFLPFAGTVGALSIFSRRLWRSIPETAAPLILMALGLLGFIAAAYWTAKTSAPCKPGDRGFYIGHAMLMEGCPDRVDINSEGRLIYRSDGSVTPP
jgi:hypothetical protein